MTTLRKLASLQEIYTLDDWIRYASRLGLSPDPDAPINADAISVLKEHISEFAMISASGRKGFASGANSDKNAVLPQSTQKTPTPIAVERKVAVPVTAERKVPVAVAVERKVAVPVTAQTPAAVGRKVAVPAAVERKNPVPSAERKNPALVAAERMDALIQNNYVFLDMLSFVQRVPTCHEVPLLDKPLEELLSLLVRHGKKLNVIASAYRQLSEWIPDTSDPERGQRCKDLVDRMMTLYDAGRLMIRKTNADRDPTQDMITMCGHHRMEANLLIITQDEKMAADLMQLNKQKSVETPYRIQVKRIDLSNGYVDLVNVIEKSEAVSCPGSFRIYSTVREGADEVLPMTEQPATDSEVYLAADLSGGAIRLLELLGEGGEGAVYRTNTPYVAKIYKKECCTAYRREKIDLMVNAKDKDGNRLTCPGVCFPEAALYNRYGEFVGYLMPEAKGIPLSRTLKKRKLEELGWKRKDLVICANYILSQIKFLHDYNILMGDINPKNFLVVSPTEVYIVDTDSFQLNDLPCPVAFSDFLAPEIHAKQRAGEFSKLSEIMRTKESERFAVATLLFTILLPGKRPYSQQNGYDSEVDNILNMHFPYALGAKASDGVSMGPWRFMWSHLSFDVKKSFHKVFQKDEKKSEYNIKERPSLDKWRRKMRDYVIFLDDWERKLQENPDKEPNEIGVDPESLEIYPKRLKRKDPWKKYVSCVGGCYREVMTDDPKITDGIFLCWECKNKPWKEVACDYCGDKFSMNYYERYVRKVRRPYLCPSCRQRSKEVVKRGPCKNQRLGLCLGCGDNATVSLWNAAFHRYKYKNDDYPLICEECRKMGR